MDNDLQAEIKKLQTQIDKITTKPEPKEENHVVKSKPEPKVKDIEDIVDAPKKSLDAPKKSVDAPKKSLDAPKKSVDAPKPVPKKRVHKLGKFDYSQYF